MVRLRDPTRIVKFGLVGVSGIGVNTFFLWALTELAGIHYMASSPLAVEMAVLSNFLLNNLWTFRDSTAHAALPTRLVRFHLTAAGGFVINWLVLVGLTEWTGLYYLLSNLAGILAGFLWNYTLNVKWTWRQRA